MTLFLQAHAVLLGVLAVIFVFGFVLGLGKRRTAGVFGYIKNMIDRAMGEPEVNSRLVFLFHGTATALGILFLSIGFLFAHDRSGFPMMVGALGGGGVGAAIGRYFTKKGDAEKSAQPAEQ